ncbi:S-adenosyl-L-methionine-dependent methyltransferase [Durotheca rogersii]|uniref:S-adenosyl-L-methionine-dependent methyltransferase n=1 Tax=Durotheca rogersii TaxID=419775 RepID=UPI00221FCAD2|nr:S-adenosyl-L-methionine-dependent methyltransferase [Durotheca rogersii]KAI5863099.1 S-adenosyl-L-methionine-dependent methyltransferase [Durotheca rogersii]
MSSRATDVNDPSTHRHSTETTDCEQDIPELPVPELDNDVSTDDYTSDCLSTRTTSLIGLDNQLLEPDDDVGPGQFDAVSVYSPSRYPAPSVAYRVERPFERPFDEEEEDEEEDAAMEDQTINSTRSINEMDIDYVMEHGRRYCGSYYMPNDDDEQVRLQLINQVYLKAFDGELTSVPLEAPTHILDIGTAVGDWAIDMAERYPECEVTGTDISNIFERRAPQNVFWEIDDAELEWERPSDHYDLIHLRNMAGSFANWEYIYKSALACVKPGGWLEVLDFDDHKGMKSFYSFFQPGSLIHRVAQDLQEASILHGKPRGVGHLEPRLLVNAGYVDVQLTEHAIPLRTEDGSTGKFWLLAMLNGMESTCLRLLTKYKGWAAEDVRLACDMIGQEMMALALNPKRAKGFVVKVRVLKGRKPGPQSHWPRRPSDDIENLMRHIERQMMEDSDGEDYNLTDGESGYCSFPSRRPTSAERNKLFPAEPDRGHPGGAEATSKISSERQQDEADVSDVANEEQKQDRHDDAHLKESNPGFSTYSKRYSQGVTADTSLQPPTTDIPMETS